MFEVQSMDTCRIKAGIFDRYIIVKADNESLAWSGSQWVAHDDGMPTESVQVSNFATYVDALRAASEYGLHVLSD